MIGRSLFLLMIIILQKFLQVNVFFYNSQKNFCILPDSVVLIFRNLSSKPFQKVDYINRRKLPINSFLRVLTNVPCFLPEQHRANCSGRIVRCYSKP